MHSAQIFEDVFYISWVVSVTTILRMETVVIGRLGFFFNSVIYIIIGFQISFVISPLSLPNFS